MGIRTLISIGLAIVAGDARAQSRSVTVAPTCANIVDIDDVVVALNVELGADGQTIAVNVECPSATQLVVATGDRRTTIALDDVPPAARARVLALAVAEQLRPDTAPTVVVRTAQPARVNRWELGFRVDGVVASKTDAVLANLTFARRSGMFRGELAGGAVATKSVDGWTVGIVGELRGGIEPVSAGRVRLGAEAGLLAARSSRDRTSFAARLALTGRIAFGQTWSSYVSVGVGRALSGDETFGIAAIGASAGL